MVDIAAFLVGIAAVGVNFVMARVELDNLAEIGDSAVPVEVPHREAAAEVIGLGEFGLELDHFG